MSQEKNEKTEAEMTDLEYLQHTIDVLSDAEERTRKELVDVSAEIKMLQEDIQAIQTERLKKAAMSVHNQLVAGRKSARDRLKAIRVDLKHARSIHKTVRGKVRK